MTNSKKLISILIPAYCEEKNITLLYYQLVDLFLECSNYEYEIIFIDDGSTDSTWEIIADIASSDLHVQGISFSRNFGQQVALMAGYKYVSGDAIISMDSDLQHPVGVIKEMLHEWEKGFNIVYAKARKKDESFLKRESATRFYRLLSKIANIDIQENVGDFRLIDKKVLEVVNRVQEKDIYIRGIMGWLGFSHTFVLYDVPKRIYGKSHYSLSKMIKLGTDGFLGFSLVPLKIGLYIGVIMIILSIAFFSYVTIDFFINQVSYPLYKWLTIMMFGFMGLMFVFLWILGEYIGRIYNQVRQRPLYVIKESINTNITNS